MESEPTPEPGIRIPFERLPMATLRSVIEEFVTRDGTEMTDSAVKIESVLRQLRSGEVEVWYDSETQTCNILRS
tara:strand:- start:18 stop:239 length:222 start_codon:yes stop_codon:yes gene_type:complete